MEAKEHNPIKNKGKKYKRKKNAEKKTTNSKTNELQQRIEDTKSECDLNLESFEESVGQSSL